MQYFTQIAPRYIEPVFTITPQSIGTLLGIVISFSIIATLFFKIVSKFNEIDSGIKDLESTSKDYNTNLIALSTVQKEVLQKDFFTLEKRFDIHIQNYLNRQEVVQMILTQLKESIENKTSYNNIQLNAIHKEIKDLQQYLKKQSDFTIRE